jgi:hypothetical protein
MRFTQALSYNVFGAMALILGGSQVVTSAHAQSAKPGPTAIAPPGVVNGQPEGVAAVPPPPAGFDPTTASAEENARYKVPPAPDPQASPQGYAAWAAAVTSKALRESPVLTKTNITNGPARDARGGGPIANNAVTTTSSNWSGSATLHIANPKNTEAVEAYFVVPTAHQAFGACDGGWDYSSVWPGIDGAFISPDVLQGGIEADAYCNGGTKSTLYSAWIEWFPFNETRVSSPVITPGDYLFVEVWNVSTTLGYVYFHDYSSNVTAEYQLTAPSGTTLQGNSVEWVVERPGVGGGLATLANYIDTPLTYGIAWDYTNAPRTNYFPNRSPTVGTLNYITMYDNNGNDISTGYGGAYFSLLFYDYGSACGASVTTAPPC